MNSQRIAHGTRVKCTAHAGAHTGQVAQDLGAVGYGVEWDGTVRVARTPEQQKFMKAFAEVHGRDMVAASADAIEVA